ncbi:MAG TPA: SDR family NAD(P)-dependent oxidoreductase, partial [Gemmatimonadaceae bacterium]|nr:SDR family NAD(P)-dependent oxidoreductase [Gemmatimonadaceae bacterium]
MLNPILITGIGRPGQVGEAVARELAGRGHPLLLVDRTEAQARDRADALRADGHQAESFAADLADPVSVEALAARLRERSGGRLAAAVLAAGGFAMSGPAAELDPAG